MRIKPRLSRRHHDDEIVDHIEIVTIPRYKTSSLSGDEWRVAYELRLSRKGTVIYRRQYTRLSYALAHLPWAYQTFLEGPNKAWEARIQEDEVTCAQVGCARPATVRYRLREIYAPNGEGPLPDEGLVFETQFCDEHRLRGDGGREDADRNYDEV